MTKIPMVFLAGMMVLPITVSSASEQYNCYRIADVGNGDFRQEAGEYVILSLDQNEVKSRIHIDATNRDVTFATCKTLMANGSDFSHWFAIECRTLIGVDQPSFQYELWLAGAYSGISPVIDKAYSKYAAIESVSKIAGVKVPDRTFVIYADRKPIYEFFCYRGGAP